MQFPEYVLRFPFIRMRLLRLLPVLFLRSHSDLFRTAYRHIDYFLSNILFFKNLLKTNQNAQITERYIRREAKFLFCFVFDLSILKTV